MRYFFKLAGGVQVLPIMDSLMRQPELWDADKTRTSIQGGPHKDAHDILLRFGNKDLVSLMTADCAPMALIKTAKDTCLTIMQLVRGTQLGRVIITRLEPGKRILPHPDEGEYAKFYTRYHLVLQGLPGSMFTCGDETVMMTTGDLWWFDSSTEHSAVNNSKDDRIHMIIDVRIDP